MDLAIDFRPLTRLDLPLLGKWLSEPHIDRWWREPHHLIDLEAKYVPRIEGKEPTFVFIVNHDGQPIGWIQWYRWLDYAAHGSQLKVPMDSAGLDLAIGPIHLI